MLPPAVGGNDPNIALILLGLELSYDAAAYGTCEVGKMEQGTPAASVTGGVFHPSKDSFSVALPSFPAGAGKPSIDIIQPTVLPSDYVMFRLMDDETALKSGAVAYGVGTSRETAAQASEPLGFAAVEEMRRSALTSPRLGSNALPLLHHEPVMLDGRPAVFAVYGFPAAQQWDGSSPLYLLTYFTRYQALSAAIVIYWRGDCPDCVNGLETGIRGMDPAIGRFVDSFHLNEAVAASLKPVATGQDQGAAQQVPALPAIAIPPGKALVYFYRRSSFAGGGLHFDVQENGANLGSMPNGSYLHALVEPGAHTFTLSAWNMGDQPCQVETKEAQIYYLEVFPKPAPPSLTGIFKSPTILGCREVDDLDAQLALKTLKEAD